MHFPGKSVSGGFNLCADIAAIAAIETPLIAWRWMNRKGPLSDALAGRGTERVTVCLPGSRTGSGIPDERVEHDESKLNAGGILTAVQMALQSNA